MSLTDLIKDVASVPLYPVKKILSIPVGSSENPNGPTLQRPSQSAPSTDIRTFIDEAIGKDPRDEDIVNFLTKIHPRFSKAIDSLIGADDDVGYLPYSQKTDAVMGTGQTKNNLVLDPYSPVDQQILELIQKDERVGLLYLRETDPSKLLPFLPPEVNPRQVKTLGSKVLDSVVDVFGRPIGTALEALAWPSQQVENFIGDKFFWNGVSDPYVRNQLLKSTYEFGITGTDWNFQNSRVDSIKSAANELFRMGYEGEDAWKMLAPTLKDNMSTRAAIFGFMSSASLDPLFAVGPFVKGAAAGTKAVAPTIIGSEKLGKLAETAGLLGKAGRAVGPGRALLGNHTMREILAADELTYQGWRLATPPRGAVLRLFEQNPSGFASETVRRLNNVFTRNDSLTPDAIAVVDRALSTGQLDDEAVAMLGSNFLNDPRIARFSQMLQKGVEFKDLDGKRKTVKNLSDLMMGPSVREKQEWLERFSGLAEAHGANDAGAIMRKLVTAHIEQLAYQEQSNYLGKFVMGKLRPMVNAEKAVMGVFSLSRPSFVPLNMANNLFTFMWHAANPLNTIDYARTWGKSMFTQATTGLPGASYPEEFRKILGVANISPAVAEDIIQSGSSAGDLLALSAKRHLAGEADNLDELLKYGRQLEKNPAKIRDDFSWKSVLSWPVNMAGRVDIATKRAAYMMSLKEQYHWALSPKLLGPKMREVVAAKGFDGPEAERIVNKLVSNLRASANRGEAVLTPENMEKVWRETIDDLKDGLVNPLSSLDYMLKWAAERGLTGDGAWAHISPLQSLEEKLNDILDDIPTMTKRQRDAALTLINDDIYDFDYLQSVLTKTQPVIRKGWEYNHDLHITEESLRQSLVDEIGHMERLFGQVFPGHWNGRLRRDFYERVGGLLSEHMDELSAIRKAHNEAVAAGGAPSEVTGPMWREFFENRKTRTSEVYEAARKAVGEVHEGPLERLDEWYANHVRTAARHEEIVQNALRSGTDEEWAAANENLKNLYMQQARKNAEIFGWSPTENPINYGHERPSALLAHRADDFIEWMKSAISRDLLDLPPEVGEEAMQVRNRLNEIRRASRAGNQPPRSSLPKPGTGKVFYRAVPADLPYGSEGWDDIAQQLKANADNFGGYGTYWGDQKTAEFYGKNDNIVLGVEWDPSALGAIDDNGQRIKKGMAGRVVSARVSDKDGVWHELKVRGTHGVWSDLPDADEMKTEAAALRAKLKELEAKNPVSERLQNNRSILSAIEEAVPALSRESGDMAAIIRANAMAKTDFVMLNYNQQYGIDTVMQAFFPYMFFPSRTMMNWGIRMARAPGAGALIAKALTAPKEYGELYGYPSRTTMQIPVPMPFLDDFLAEMPGVNSLIQKGQFSNLYWVNPMQMMFPMANFASDYNDEKRQGTPLGMVADWIETNLPFGFTPVFKILGSEAGLLDKQAWEQSMFSGGPFGIPVTPTARMVAAWLQNGQDTIPEEEKDNYSNGGFFSPNLLTRILGLTNERFDEYRAERSLWALVAQGEIDADKAWDAMLTHKGPEWRQAVKTAQSDQFMRELTGSIFARVTPVQEGELKIKMGMKQAYDAATRKGPDALKEFYKQFPEYSGYQAAVKGLTSPEDRQKAVETEIYYRTVQKYVDQPYRLRLDRFSQAIEQLEGQEQTEGVRDQLKVLQTQLTQVKAEQAALRSVIDASFPNREQNLSLSRDPRERALATVRGEWYDLLKTDLDLDDDELALARRVLLNDEPADKDLKAMQKILEREAERQMAQKAEAGYGLGSKLEQAQKNYLLQFAPAKGQSDPMKWHEYTVAAVQTKLQYGQAMQEAVKNEDFARYHQLQAQREADLEKLHAQAQKDLTRWDVETYLANFNKPKTPEQQVFEEANSLFDLWMALVGDKSTLTNKQQAAVSAYFREQPAIKKHFHSSSLDLEKLTVQQKYAIMRRREIWSTYYDMPDDASQVDYIQSVSQELNAVNGLLGLPRVNVMAPTGMPPYVQLGNGASDFRRDLAADQAIYDEFKDEALSPDEKKMLATLVQQRDPTTMSEAEIDRFLRLSFQRGY